MLVRVAVAAALLGAGWILGSIYPAPPALTNMVAQRTDRLAEKAELDWEALKGRLTSDEIAAVRRDAAEIAAKSGDAIIVERAGAPLAEHAEALEAAAKAPAPTGFETTLSLCPGMTVANAPPANGQRQVSNFAPIVNVEGVRLAVNPTHEACLSSGFGQRGSSLHKGVDYHNPTGGMIVAAADGTVVEKKYRDDYGNMLVIDHGHGVYTRYAHLSNFADGAAVGAHVRAGQQIGLMGNTASYRIPVHLHYELLLGDYSTQAGSFGLTPHNPFEYPAAS